MTTDAPVINITGERVLLGPVRTDLLPLYTRWVNDFRLMRTKDDPPLPMTTDQYAAVVESAGNGPDGAWFTVYERETLRPIGITGLFDISQRHRSAEYAVHIGEADMRGRGYGTEITTLMLDYAFRTLGLHNVMLRVFAFNLAGVRAYEKAGFRRFGVREQAWRMGGRLWDVVYMQCTAG